MMKEKIILTIKKVLSRFRSWATWVALAGAVWVLLSSFGIPERIGLTSEGWNAILNALGTILAVFGITNDPTNREGF